MSFTTAHRDLDLLGPSDNPAHSVWIPSFGFYNKKLKVTKSENVELNLAEISQKF